MNYLALESVSCATRLWRAPFDSTLSGAPPPGGLDATIIDPAHGILRSRSASLGGPSPPPNACCAAPRRMNSKDVSGTLRTRVVRRPITGCVPRPRVGSPRRPRISLLGATPRTSQIPLCNLFDSGATYRPRQAERQVRPPPAGRWPSGLSSGLFRGDRTPVGVHCLDPRLDLRSTHGTAAHSRSRV